MAQQQIDTGDAANDGTGDDLRTAFGKANDNFDELYGRYSFLKRQASSAPTIDESIILQWGAAVANYGSDISWDAANPSRLTVGVDGVYRVGGVFTAVSGAQRAMFVAEILVNGVAQGGYRGTSYIRNSGSTWDYWALEVAPEPFVLTADDYIEIRLGQVSVSNASYSLANDATITVETQGTFVWVERAA